jgi:superfamily I DNA/RNA helicase
VGEATADGLGRRVTVLAAEGAKGLEFDAVVVVEPALIAAVGQDSADEGPPVATTRGLRTLYVAMTRPTRRLALVYAEPLPVDLQIVDA